MSTLTPKCGIVRRTRDGKWLCASHRSSGAPAYYYPGCKECEDARAKGIVRPDAETVPAKQRGRQWSKESYVNHEWLKMQHAAIAESHASSLPPRKAYA